jgi:hypothetical protein
MLGRYLGGRTDRWRRESGRVDASIEEALKGLYDSKARTLLLIFPVTGMLFSAPILIILGLAIAAVGLAITAA